MVVEVVVTRGGLRVPRGVPREEEGGAGKKGRPRPRAERLEAAQG